MANESRGKAALKAGTWYVISSIMVKAVAIISTPIFSRLLTKEEYGMVATFISWNQLLLPLFTLNLTYSIGRAKLDFPEKLDDYIGSSQLLSAIVSLVLAVFGIIFITPLSAAMELNEAGTLLLILYLVFTPAINFYQSGYRYRYKYKQNIAIAWYIALSTVIVSLILILVVGGDNSLWRMTGIALPTVVLSLYFWYRSFRQGVVKPNKEYWAYGWRLSGPLILHTISMHILSQSDRIFISKICGKSDTGVYSLVYTYGTLLYVITHAINEAWLPWFHDTFFEEGYDKIRKNVFPIVVLGCYIGLACIALAPEMIFIFGGKQYMEGVNCVPPIVLGVVCQFIYTHYVNIELHLKKTMYVSNGTIFAAVLNIVLNAIFITKFGYIAAAYTTLASYMALMLVHFLITRLKIKVHIYNDLFLFGAMLVTFAVSLLIASTYDKSPWIRYLILVIGFATFVAYFRKYFGVVIRKFKKKSKKA